MCGYTPDELLDLALENSTAALFNPLNLDFTRTGIFDGRAILKIFEEWTHKADIRDGRIPFMAVAYDLIQNRSILIDKGRFADAMRASSSIPYILAPHRWGKYLMVDGGIEHPLPAGFADLLPGEVCIAVNVLPPTSNKAEKIDLSGRTNEAKMSLHQVFMQSLMQNQAFIALQEMLEFKPDIYIDAHDSRHGMMDLSKARDFVDYGRKAARIALREQSEAGIMDQLRSRYQKLLSRIREPLESLRQD